MNYSTYFNQFKCLALHGRYVTNNHIEPLLDNLSIAFNVEQIGHSENELPVYSVNFGSGKIKILMWSQMHGNESTTTKALFDFFNFLQSDNKLARKIASSCTLKIIPILNPDGALAYTRVNANAVDLNRDSVALSQKESKLLRKQIDEFKPDFCLNLHDQRTIFGTKGYKLPATVSFLAPSYNDDREINNVRETAMKLIVAMNTELQKYIPNQVGRFDDGFNINCIGDMCTSLGIPTILFEAGHYQNDYEREETRKYIFISYLAFFEALLTKSYEECKIDNYLEIPENSKSFFDILCVNFEINVDNYKKTIKFALQYEEVLIDNRIEFVAKISEIDNIDNLYGHVVYDFSGIETTDFEFNKLNVGQIATFQINKKLKIENGLLIKQ